MKIIKIGIYKFSIPMNPFVIATGTMDFAQNIFIRVFTDAGFYGVGECSAFPMIAGETQATCFEMAKDFAKIWKNKNPLEIKERMNELHSFTAFNTTIKSAFDMALYDIAAKHANLPLYQYLGGNKYEIETDLTIGIESPAVMAEIAIDYKKKGVRTIKIKLGKNGEEDIARVKQIRTAVGDSIQLRIDANQGWSFETAVIVLQEIGKYHVQFCEQPMRYWDDDKLPMLRKLSPVKIMADESVFSHHDAGRLIEAGGCDYVNIKLAKSGGILEAIKVNQVCESHFVECMMGGMLESRIAISAAAHFALAHSNITFYDLDSCLIGHKVDPVKNGAQYTGFFLNITDLPGIGADADDEFLNSLEQIII